MTFWGCKVDKREKMAKFVNFKTRRSFNLFSFGFKAKPSHKLFEVELICLNKANR